MNADPHVPVRRRRRLLPALALLIVIIGGGAFVVIQLLDRGTPPAVADSDTGAVSDSTATDESDSTKKEDGEEGDEEKPDPVPVEVASVERRDVPSFFSGTATLEAENEARILARAAGQIVRLPVEEGQRVREGELLLELDGDEQAINLEERKADLLQLEHDMQQKKTLFERDLGSESEYINTKAQYEAAVARRRAAELAYEFTKVEAPFSGIVTQRLVGIGEHTAVGQELFHLADPDPLRAQVYMPEREVGRIHVGQEVEIRSDTGPGATYHGSVSLIAPIVDRRTGTVKVTVALTANDGRLRPGSFVRVFIETDRHPNALIVSERAIVEQGGEAFVFVVDEENKVRRTRVETGYAYEDDVEILTGLDEGTRVVTAGQGSLKDDLEVRVIGDGA